MSGAALPAAIGIAIAAASVLLEWLFNRNVFDGRGRGMRLLRRVLIAAFAILTVGVCSMVLALLWFLPWFLFHADGYTSRPTDVAGAIAVLLPTFFASAYLWHTLLFMLPVGMLWATRTILNSSDLMQFPKLIDYAYYAFAAVGLSFAFLDATFDGPVSGEARVIYLFAVMLILGLRFTKVTLDRRPGTYLPDDVLLRTQSGTVLWRRRGP